ncbi:MAG: right-handed parallel beta-helix repeat-containing protein [Planctomycetes bacterium]|nr:right-handed parallel beta-helix repeat-containing protein [Planctomycetota bacterium]
MRSTKLATRGGVLLLTVTHALAQIPIAVTSPTEAALRTAFVQANQQAFLTSPTNPVVITLASSLIGQTIPLLNSLPELRVDHVRIVVAGAGPTDRVILDAPRTTGCLLLTAHDAQIANLTFARVGSQSVERIGDAVIASGAVDVTFTDCTFFDAAGIGLWLYGTRGVTVRRCRFESNGDIDPGPGMRCIDGCEDLLIDTCTFVDNQDAGLVLAGTRNATIVGSTFLLNRYGVLATAVTFGLTFGPGNTIQDSDSIGMLLHGAVDGVVQGNAFVGNGSHGLSLGDRSVRTIVRDNDFTANADVTTSATQFVVANSDDIQLLGNRLQNGFGDGAVLIDCNRVTIGPSPGRAMTITATRRGGLLATRTADLNVLGVTLTGNQATASSGAQLQASDCTRVSLRGVIASTTATSNLTGISLSGGSGATIGGGTTVTGHRNVGITVRNVDDVVLGERGPVAGTAGLTVRNNGTGVQFVDCTRGAIAIDGAVGAQVLLDGNGPAAGANLSGGSDLRVGPGVTIDSGHLAAVGLQVLGGAQRAAVRSIVVRNHVQHGISFNTATDCSLGHSLIDGNASAPRATGTGVQAVLADRIVLLDNLVRGHAGDGIRIDSSPGARLLPGNRCLFQNGDGIVAMNGSGLSPMPIVTIQSAAVVGNNLGVQSGFRCNNVDARLVQCTATRHITGLNLQGSSSTTAVNSIFWGNVTRDRNKATTATGRFYTCLHRSGTFSAGSGWQDQGNLLDVDPRFVAAATGDVSLQAGSPAIDAGRHATPAGITLPCTDVLLAARVRGQAVDVGATERPASTAFDLAGPWLRSPDASLLTLTLQVGATFANQPFMLWASGSGTGAGFALPGGQVPLNVDAITALLFGAPALSQGLLDGTGRGTLLLPIPPAAVPLLPPELTFVATWGPTGITNPVITRFER